MKYPLPDGEGAPPRPKRPKQAKKPTQPSRPGQVGLPATIALVASNDDLQGAIGADGGHPQTNDGFAELVHDLEDERRARVRRRPRSRRELIGEEGKGFFGFTDNLPQERISVAVAAIATAQAALTWTSDYVRERRAFGTPIGELQVTGHNLADPSPRSRSPRCTSTAASSSSTPIG